MPDSPPPLRADARRNKARILEAAGALFAHHGQQAQIEEIAAKAGVGVGTLYRHFPTKQALLAAIVGARFQRLATVVRLTLSPLDATVWFESVLHAYLVEVEGDTAFQWALLSEEPLDWDRIQEDKRELQSLLVQMIDGAVAAGVVRPDFTFDDFVLLTRGVMATMFSDPKHPGRWRRHLDLILNGVRRISI